jgi:penicillin-binding protein 2
MFHFGEQTGIDMPSEKKGFFPTPEWKKSKMKMTWLQGDTVILSIGQGALTVTPLQMAAFMTAIANKGVYYKPYLVDKIVDTDTNELIYKHTPQVKDKIVLKEETWKTLSKALIETVENGTGKRTKFENMKVAAKTGTAENPHGDDHAWVVAYAPADNPEIAIAVIVENGGGGGTVSVPVAREIFKYYFNIKDEDENTDTKKGNKINAAR